LEFGISLISVIEYWNLIGIWNLEIGILNSIMLFSYSVRDEYGKLVAGKIKAPSREAAISLLQRRGYFILSLEELEKKSIFEKIFEFFKRVKKKDLLIFWRRFAVLLNAGVPLNRTLKTLYYQARNPNLKEALYGIISDVEEGISLSNSFAKYPYIFSDFFINLLRAAEISGRIEQTVEYIASYLEREVSFSRKIFNALIYPTIVVILFIGVIIIMTVFVFPQLSNLFEASGVEIPLTTQIFLNIGSFLVSWGWIIVLILVFLVIFLIDYFRTKEGKVLWSEIQLKLPIFGEIFKKIATIRFFQGLAVLIKGGISIPTAIEMAGKITSNSVFEEVAFEIADGVRRGESFSNLISNYPDIFDELVGSMIAVGEETGKIDALSEKVSQFYQEEVNSTLSTLSELIQPIIIIILGIFVAVLIASILWPIYSLVLSV